VSRIVACSRFSFGAAITILALAMPAAAQQADLTADRPRLVALTFDDLPAVSTRLELAIQQAITDGILGALARNGAAATAFVNEGKLYAGDRLNSDRVALLHRWLDGGHDLGNHTYSHRSLYSTPLAEFERDVLRGEVVTKRLLEEKGSTMRWFRHPTLNTGPDSATKSAFERFLAGHGYSVAPVTIDNQEWVFARAYDVALDRGDSALAGRVATTYLGYMDSIFGYYEQQSRALLGYELPQILLLHANRINAATLDSLFAVMRRRGYRFITLDRALRDAAYRRDDRYTGTAGITWLHRWALTEGRRGAFFHGEPELPTWIATLSGVGG
jgi:peptidoglycan/xylan/chitin deacetylase (PgdA/CDA1 family)